MVRLNGGDMGEARWYVQKGVNAVSIITIAHLACHFQSLMNISTAMIIFPLDDWFLMQYTDSYLWLLGTEVQQLLRMMGAINFSKCLRIADVCL